MKLIIAVAAFLITIGGLFLIGDKHPGNNGAQIVGTFKNGHSSEPTASFATTPAAKVKPAPRPQMPSPSITPTPISISTPIFILPLAVVTPAPTVTFLPTPLPSQAPAITPAPTPTTASPAPTPAPIEAATPTPAFQETVQNGFINIVSITSPIKRGSTAQLSIATLPNAQCSIKVVLPSGSQSSTAGLNTKTATASGDISWSWKIGGSTSPGDATIALNCSANSQDFSGSLKMAITSQ